MTASLDDFVRDEIEREGLKLYFDTTVILDLLRPKRRPESHRLLEIAQGNSWECTSSYFALMEALDIEQENMWFRSRIRAGEDVERLLRRRRERDLSTRALGRVRNQLYRKFVDEVQDFISWVTLGEEAWEETLGLAMSSNINATDCVHVATALTTDCNLFVTSDEPLGDLADQHICSANPAQLLSLLRRLGAGETT